MTDRELLELAAGAAGIDLGEFWTPYLGEHHAHYWNPLRDDGDALRLAVKLRLLIGIHLDESWAQSYAIGGGWLTIKEKHGDDAGAATRRAIVRCAAEIARAQADR